MRACAAEDGVGCTFMTVGFALTVPQFLFVSTGSLHRFHKSGKDAQGEWVCILKAWTTLRRRVLELGVRATGRIRHGVDR